jgi:hypothetical protein
MQHSSLTECARNRSASWSGNMWLAFSPRARSWAFNWFSLVSWSVTSSSKSSWSFRNFCSSESADSNSANFSSAAASRCCVSCSSLCNHKYTPRWTETSWWHVNFPLAGVRLSPLGTSATVGLYQPRMIGDDGAIGGMRIGRGNRSTRRKPAPVPLCPPQIPHGLTWDRTRAATVGSQRLTAWAMARPTCELVHGGVSEYRRRWFITLANELYTTRWWKQSRSGQSILKNINLAYGSAQI